jgi:hypothetical protein
VQAADDGDKVRVHTELAWNPDGTTWHHIQPGTPFIENTPGPEPPVYGEMPYDWGCIFAAAPVFLENEVRIYYGSSDWYYFGWRKGYLALATIRPDGWRHVHDVADEYPEVVKTLKEKYEEGWDDISIDFGKYNEIIIGSDKENPSTLYSHDAHRTQIWVIKVAKEGKYEFKLSRWPAEANKRISENKNGETDFQVKKACLNMGSIYTFADISEEQKYAKFEVHLKAGTACLQAWFEDNSQKILSADFVYLERLGAADPVAIQKYQPVDLDHILKDNSK